MFYLTRPNLCLLTLGFALFACSPQVGKLAEGPDEDGDGNGDGDGDGDGAEAPGDNSTGAVNETPTSVTPPAPLPSSCTVPDPVPFAEPLETRVVGDGTPASCTNEAMQEAATAGGHITFDCGEDPLVIPISTTVFIGANAILDGGGKITLDGGGAARIIWMRQALQVEIHGFTFVNGSAVNVEHIDSGSAIRGGRDGILYVKDCIFTGNVSGEVDGEGGAIAAPIGSMNTVVNCHFEDNFGGNGSGVHGIGAGYVIVNSTFINNKATSRGGGGLYTDGGDLISLCGCRFTSNEAEFQGGAAYIWTYPPSTVEIRQSVFEKNRVIYSEEGRALGGAVRTSDATVYVDQTLFVDNDCDDKGGAFWVNGNYPSYVTNSTFINNEAKTGGAITGNNMEITNVTFDGNYATNNGGAISNRDDTVVLRNSILRNNLVGDDRAKSCQSALQGANNLQWPDPEGETPCTEDEIVAEPLLHDLADNGGPTETMALNAESPALDQGVDCPDIDQRGETRASSCDLGAFEL